MKQYSTPIIIQSDKIISLEKVSFNSNQYNEAWIQNICFQNPSLLPLEEIEPTFSDMIPICRELSTESGYIDIIYLNDAGLITICEFKLWRNPEARRKAVGQILDYAKDLSKWNYQKFERECLKANSYKKKSLFEIIQEYQPEVEEAKFIDNVQKNLRKGRFLLALVGDGIRENMEEIADYIHRNGNLNFTLVLIEIPIYKNPSGNELVITPRVLAKTKEIERIVFRLSEEESESKKSETKQISKGTSVSEKIFFERLENNIGKEKSLQTQEFINKLTNELNIIPKLGRGKRLSINLKSPDDTYNFGSIQENGEVWFYGLVSKTNQIGAKQIGIDYLKKLANIVNASFDNNTKEWFWSVKRKGKYLNITEYLNHQEEWIKLISEVMEQIDKYEENN